MTKKKKQSRKKKSTDFKPLFIIISLVILAYFLFQQFYLNKNKKNSIFQFVEQVPNGYNSIGIDVSHHQEKIDWDKIFLHNAYDTIIDFVYCKVSEGKSITDKNWSHNRNSLSKLNIRHGAYHFFSLSSTPEEQAAHFLSIYTPQENDLPPVLDVETEDKNNEDLVYKMKKWLQTVEDATGRRPIIYTSLHFFETKFKNEFQNYKFWIAAYRGKLKINDKRIIHWQFTDKAKLIGIDGYIDASVSFLFNK
ncbi:GH25 family lysozyme [Crocinitomicaceae bacterium]|nr:GH25 family lysozyme [Crocinitomicaceae bacterium]